MLAKRLEVLRHHSLALQQLGLLASPVILVGLQCYLLLTQRPFQLLRGLLAFGKFFFLLHFSWACSRLASFSSSSFKDFSLACIPPH